MRLDAVNVSNFRGIERAELHGLAEAPLITVSGTNGAGKSLLFEAIALVWRVISLYERQQIIPSALIGPWDDMCSIDIAVVLNDEERHALADFSRRAGFDEPEDTPASMGIDITHAERPLGFRVETWAAPLWTTEFTRTHGFANVDFFPADRSFPRGEVASVNPALLMDEQREGFRDQIVGSFANERQLVTLSGIAPVLASLDYVDLLAHREGLPPSGEFDALAGAFAAATSKRLLRPVLDAESPQGSTLRVETPAGIKHTINQLSSGEQEVLGLMYFVRRLSARGGVLLIDEPELHLHPSLQRALFSILESTAGRAQVWIATHSPRLITAAPLDAIVRMVPASGRGDNQLHRASDEEDRMRLLEDLGVHPVEALQSDALVVVEGSTDTQRLSSFLPLEFGRTVTLVAGTAKAVEASVKMLNEGSIPIPYLGIRDRDYLSDSQVSELESQIPNLVVWRRRSIEGEMLHPPLIVETLQRVFGWSTTEEEITAQLLDIANRQRDDIHAELVGMELQRMHEYTREGSTPLERQAHHLSEMQRVASEKLVAFDEIAQIVRDELDSRWDDDFLELADGKRLLAEYASVAPFRSIHDLIAALAQTVNENPALLPPGFVALRERMRDLFPSPSSS